MKRHWNALDRTSAQA